MKLACFLVFKRIIQKVHSKLQCTPPKLHKVLDEGNGTAPPKHRTSTTAKLWHSLYLYRECGCVNNIDHLDQSMWNLSDLPFFQTMMRSFKLRKWGCWRNSCLIFVLIGIGLMFMAKWRYHQHHFGQTCTWPSPFLTFRASWRAIQTWICHVAQHLPSLLPWPHDPMTPRPMQARLVSTVSTVPVLLVEEQTFPGVMQLFPGTKHPACRRAKYHQFCFSFFFETILCPSSL